MEKIYAHQSNLSSDIEDIKDGNRFYRLSHSAPSSQVEYLSQQKKPDRPLLSRSRSLEDFRYLSKFPIDIKQENSVVLPQCREKKISRHSIDNVHYIRQRSLGESISNDSDSKDTLLDLSRNSPSGKDNTASPKLVGNIRCKSSLDRLESSKEIPNNEPIEIKSESVSDEDDCSMPLFNYSQEDEFILISDSDEEANAKTQFEDGKDIGQICNLGNVKLEDADTQPCPDFNDEIKLEQCPKLDTGEVVQIEKSFTVCTPIKQQEVSNLSTSPKFMKNKLDHLNSESFKNNPMLVMETKKEPKSDSDDSDDLFQEEMESQATQIYGEREWREFGIKREKPFCEQDACKSTYSDHARQKNADLLKMKSEDDMYRMSSDEDADCNESLADDGDREVKKKLKTPDLDDDDDFLCATQIDMPLDDDVIKTNPKMKRVTADDTEQNSRKRWKNITYYDNTDSDDDLFWCATQVDSNADDKNPPVLNKETFVLTNSDEDNDDMYMMATQVDKGLLSSCRVPQNSRSFKPPTLSQAKASANANGAKSYWRSKISAWPEADSDSDDSLFSVATQLDPQPMDAFDDQIYTKQTQVDFSDKPTETTSSALQKATGNAKKKRKLKHHAASKTSAFLNALHRRDASDSDSDDSVFSLATQVDNDDDDILFMRATQVDSQPFKSYKKHKTKSKTQHWTQTSLLTINDDYDSDDSVYSVSTQIDFEPPTYQKSSKLCLKNLKSQNKTSRTVINLDEEYDSDSSVFSIATQVDASTSKRKCEQIKDDDGEEEEDDIAYCMATQVDVDKKRTTPAASQKSDIFKVPFFPKKRLKVTPPVEKDTEAVTPGRKETISNSASEIDSPFGSFLLGIAEGEMGQVVMKSSEKDVEEAEKNKDAKNSEETEKGFSKFLLDLSDVPQSKPVSQTCPVEPLRLKTRKEMRQSFKNQCVKDVPKSPEEKLHPKAVVKASSTNDTWLSKSKKPVQNKKLLEKEAISRKINEARNQLEERYFLSHLDPSKVGWNKSSHIQYGSSSTITDVQLPDEEEIRKKGLPITESLQRRKPLPDIPTEHFPEEKWPDVHDPVVNTPLNTIEQTSPTKTSQICTNTSPRKSGLVASTQFYKNSRLDTFKIPKLPPLKVKQPCDPVTVWKLNPLQTSSTEKRPTRLPSEFLAQPFQVRQNMNEIFKATHTKAGYSVKQPTKKFSSCDNSSYVLSKQNSHSSKTFCSDNKNLSLQDGRINSNNTRDILLKHILKWNPKWLSEQKNIKQTPPIVKMDELLPLLNCYTSLEDYQSIFKPLLLLEIWESIYKDFMENCHKNRKWQVAFCNVQIVSSLMDYIVYGVISIKDYNSRKQMMEGDIVKVNLQVRDPQATNTGNTHSNVLYEVMGIVVSVRFYDSQFYSEKLEQFPQLASLPEVKSRFKIYRAIIKVRYRKLIHAFTDLMTIELISSSIPHLRQFEALMCLSSNLLYSQILNPRKGESAESGISIPSTKNYNSSQLKAISAAACIVQKPPDQPSYCLVQGPPGTGKSHTIIGIINKIKEINSNCKILLCAPSNGAIDELTRRLIKERHKARAESRQALKIVRIGNRDNIHEDVSSYSIFELIKTNNVKIGNQKCEKMYPELNRICINEKKIFLKLSNMALREKDNITEEQRRKLEKDLRNLKEKKKFLMKQCELKQSVTEPPTFRQETELRQSILQKADVICSTLNTCGSLMYLNDLGGQRFDCIIIDEASQCTELDCLIPLQYNCCKLILFGDTEQLAPTVLSQQAADYNYGLSLFERLCNYFKDREEEISNPVIMLNCQYRMHPEICKFASRYIYENKLLTDTNLKLRSSPISIVPYLMFDIQNGEQVRSAQSGSLSNPMEAEFTVDLCEYLIGLNTSNSSFAIGIIAPYKLQTCLLQDLLTKRKMKKIEVTTVDGFQGREKDIIIMSCVRAHGSCRKIGFLTNRKRLNVALTRAKYALYIVGHLHSLKIADEDWKSLIEDAHQRNLVVPVKCGNSAKLAFRNCVKS